MFCLGGEEDKFFLLKEEKEQQKDIKERCDEDDLFDHEHYKFPLLHLECANTRSLD